MSRETVKTLSNRLSRSDLFRLSACTRCGDCLASCPVYEQTGDEAITARAKISEAQRVVRSQIGLLAKIRGPKRLTEEELKEVYGRLASCTGCAACATWCPSDITTDELWVHLRSWLHDRGTGVEGAAKASLDNVADLEKANPFGEPAEERGSWLPKSLREVAACENLYFAGCVASYSANRLAKSVVKVLESAEGFRFMALGNDEVCCGDPLARIGYVDEARQLQERNVEMFRSRGVRRIFTACAGCYKNLKHFCPDDIAVQHIVELYAELIREGKISFGRELNQKAVYFDGCDLGRHSGVYEAPREVLRAIPGLEVMDYERNREEGMCCGGPLMAADNEMAKKIAQERVREAAEMGADVIVTSCPACMLNLRAGAQEMETKVQVQDLPLLLPSLLQRKRPDRKNGETKPARERPRE